MPITIGNDLKSHIGGETTTVAVCWKITRDDSEVFAFTSHDQDLTVGGVTYEASSGFLPSAIDKSSQMNVDNLEAVSFLDSDKITKADIEAGLFDGAELDIFFVNYENLAQGVAYLAQGWKIGNLTTQDHQFVAEVRSKSQHLQEIILDMYGPACRADLGDTRCGVNVAASYTVTGTVTGVTDNRVFADTSRVEATDVFAGGKLTWTGGNNNGYEMEVKAFDPGPDTIGLFLPMPRDIQVGDTYSLTYGCDKSLATCRDVFDNVDNYRGEPYLPGLDGLYRYV